MNEDAYEVSLRPAFKGACCVDYSELALMVEVIKYVLNRRMYSFYDRNGMEDAGFSVVDFGFLNDDDFGTLKFYIEFEANLPDDVSPAAYLVDNHIADPIAYYDPTTGNYLVDITFSAK